LLSRRGAGQEAGSGRRRRERARGVPVPRPAVRGKSPQSLHASARNHNRFNLSRDKTHLFHIYAASLQCYS
jgi:hypothetical protein